MDLIRVGGRQLARFTFDHIADGDDKFLFHYTSATSLALIVDNGIFRFSRLAGLNDPRENRSWTYSLPPGVDGDGSEVDPAAFQAQFDHDVRQPVRIFSATVEDEGSSEDATFLRGFSRARNWAQYGDDHRGACIVLHRSAFEDDVKEAAAGLGPGLAVHSERVTYEDRQATRLADGTFIRADDPERWLRDHWRDLFFRKNLDWQSESERRIAVLGVPGDEALEVPIADALVGIALGVDFPTEHESVFEHRLTRARLDHVVVCKMMFQNGAPDCHEAGYGLETRCISVGDVRDRSITTI